ncbi:MAG: 30S ribosomal protein S18 [Firmicutes bacterium]|nr:30S ribosomal protein S18 [Bacillota bacterium]
MAKERRRGRRGRRKVCNFCVDKIEQVDYKETGRLRRYLSERGKILPRRISGNCARHQRQLTVAIKRARQVALLPYSAE